MISILRTTRTFLFLTLCMGHSFTAFAQIGGRGPMATSALGHMAVTLLTPAALTSAKNLEFRDIPLRSGEATSAAIESDMSMASIRVSGTAATYSVTVSNKNFGFSQNGRTISVSTVSSVSTMEETGASSIYIGATMRISKRAAVTTTETSAPLAVTINYN
jgi:uncharacterized membrane protein